MEASCALQYRLIDSTNLQRPSLDSSDSAIFLRSISQRFNGVRSSAAATGTNANIVAIDNKIEQAMDLVKTHLLYAVREEVEVLKVRIVELEKKVGNLEKENKILREYAPPEVLAQLAAAASATQQQQLQQQQQQLQQQQQQLQLQQQQQQQMQQQQQQLQQQQQQFQQQQNQQQQQQLQQQQAQLSQASHQQQQQLQHQQQQNAAQQQLSSQGSHVLPTQQQQSVQMQAQQQSATGGQSQQSSLPPSAS